MIYNTTMAILAALNAPQPCMGYILKLCFAERLKKYLMECKTQNIHKTLFFSLNMMLYTIHTVNARTRQRTVAPVCLGNTSPVMRRRLFAVKVSLI